MSTKESRCACGHLLGKHDQTDNLRCYAKIGPSIDAYCPCFHFSEKTLSIARQRSAHVELGLLCDIDDWDDRQRRVFTEDDYGKCLPADPEWELKRALQAVTSRSASDEWCIGARRGVVSAAS